MVPWSGSPRRWGRGVTPRAGFLQLVFEDDCTSTGKVVYKMGVIRGDVDRVVTESCPSECLSGLVAEDKT